MKILHVIATLGPGGAEVFTASLSESMAKSGHSISVYLMAGVQGERGELLADLLEKNNVRIFGKSPRSPKSIQSFIGLARCVREIKPDIIHAHLISAEIMVAVNSLILGFPRKRLFRTLHNTEIRGKRTHFFLHLLDRIFPQTIACGDAVSDQYLRFFGKRMKTRLSTIDNGIRLEFKNVTPDKSNARKSLNIGRDRFIITNIAAFRGESLEKSQKAQDIAIKAFKLFHRYQPNSRLIFIGDGPLMESAKDLAREMDVEQAIRFTGALANPRRYLEAADVFFLPSRHEGLPISLLEAASSGLPVVASDIPEIKNLNDNFPWFLASVDNADSFFECLIEAEHKSMTTSLDEASDYRSRIGDKYDIDNCGASYLMEYEKALLI